MEHEIIFCGKKVSPVVQSSELGDESSVLLSNIKVARWYASANIALKAWKH